MTSLELTLIYLLAAVLGVVIFRAFRLPPMLGYLMVGVVIGPNMLAMVENSTRIQHLAEFGVVFLMFVIGLEFSLPKLRTMRRHVFGLGAMQVGLTMVLCFAGMQAISPSLLESARLEGAGDWAILRKIILPLIMSFVQLSAIFALMSGLKIYDTVLALTNGGPGKFSVVMPMWIMQNAFSFNQYGYGAAMSVIFVLIVLAGMLLTKRLIKGDSYEL